MYSFRFRDYSPTQGRWIQLDPLGFGAGDVNLYRFVFNNPANLTDPSGLDVFYFIAWGWDSVTGGYSTRVLTSETFGNALDQTDRFFAGWSHSLTGGNSTIVREIWWGDAATRNHQGTVFVTGQWVGQAHNVALIAAGGYQTIQGVRQLIATGGARWVVMAGGPPLLLANGGALARGLYVTANGTVAVSYGVTVMCMTAQNPNNGSNGGGNAPRTRADVHQEIERTSRELEGLNQIIRRDWAVERGIEIRNRTGSVSELIEQLRRLGTDEARAFANELVRLIKEIGRLHGEAARLPH